MADRLEYQTTFRGKTRTLDYHSLDVQEWADAERATGLHWGQLAQHFDARSATGLKTILWLTLRREDRNLGYRQLKFTPTELVFEVITDDEADDEDGAGGGVTQGPPSMSDSPTDP